MSDGTQLQPKQVAPLPIGSGGSSATKQQLNSNNVALSMMTAQAAVDAKFDGPVPKHVTEQAIVQKFCSGSPLSLEESMMVVGGLLIVYGIIAK
jgi:hypothetical protein